MSSSPLPIVWTIAGSDSGGGAGIQADLKTMNQLGVYGASVVTAVTAQNTLGVTAIQEVSRELVTSQLNALRDDLSPKSIKLGMLYSKKVVDAIFHILAGLKEIDNKENLSSKESHKDKDLDADRPFVVCDPVMVATSGDALAQPELIEALKSKIIPKADLLTPNLEEARALLEHEVENRRGVLTYEVHEVEKMAAQLLRLGCRSVLLKGGSQNSELESDFCSEFSQDYWTNGSESAWLTSRRIKTKNTHGTGCTLSSAIASAVALGYHELDAVVIAKAYVNQGLRNAPQLGQGQGPMCHGSWPECEQDIPWITRTAQEGRECYDSVDFPDCGEEKLGFYPIVDSYQWLQRLLPLGIKTVQLRIKNLEGAGLENEIAQSVELSKKYNCRLFVNDYWEAAIKYGAYGIHLGQDDLNSADISKIRAAGIRLGISTHCYREVARALAIRPSYIAVGPIHPTTTKEMKFNPQGVEAFKRWRRTLNYPLIAIGGIFLDNAQELIDAGADGIAVVRDVTQAADLNSRVSMWRTCFNGLNVQHNLRGLRSSQAFNR